MQRQQAELLPQQRLRLLEIIFVNHLEVEPACNLPCTKEFVNRYLSRPHC